MFSVTERLFRLNQGYGELFCPETRFHLIRGIRPQGVYPADLPLSEILKRGLRGGTILDVNGAVSEDELKGLPRSVESEESTIVQKAPQETVEAPVVESTDQAEEVKEEAAEGLSVEDINEMTKAEMKEFIEQNNLSNEELGLNSRSNADEHKDALKKYFGHEE